MGQKLRRCEHVQVLSHLHSVQLCFASPQPSEFHLRFFQGLVLVVAIHFLTTHASIACFPRSGVRFQGAYHFYYSVPCWTWSSIPCLSTSSLFALGLPERLFMLERIDENAM